MTVVVSKIDVVEHINEQLTAITITLADGRQKYMSIREPFTVATLASGFRVLAKELESP